LLRFETRALLKVNLGKISHFLTPYKIRGGVGKISELKERSIIVADVLDFQYLAPFRNQRVKGDWCRKLRQKYTLFDPLKVREGIGKIPGASPGSGVCESRV